jgi:glycosyltransferase involved in cell wall biosynthesis/peptidoglycan/xylan/chitin deacetylase (PgdA/CDA1 family)/predicted glycosyltransferase involved in capsule biosynthesis
MCVTFRMPSRRGFHTSNVDITVIVPYAGIGSPLPLLESLASQTLEASRWELLLVDETDDAAKLLARFPSINGRVIAAKRDASFHGHSAPKLRNAGARHAASDLLLFLDSDCIARRDCLAHHRARHAQAHRTESLGICGAMIELPATKLRLVAQNSTYEDLAAASITDYRAHRKLQHATWEDFYTANASISRHLFERSGGFHEKGFRCHDMELAYRLARVGARFQYAPECEVIHIEHPRVAASRLEQGEGWKQLGKTFPELEEVARRRIEIARQAYDRVVRKSESVFRKLTQTLPGRRAGTAWICPKACSDGNLRFLLDRIPHVQRICRSTVQYFLRLDRNCWDYSIIVPGDAPPRISVIIPAFNAAATVGQAIQSVQSQTLQEFEIIVVDDASSDDTARVVREHAGSDCRLISLSENGGQSVAMNRGLDAASAPLLLQLDADDWLEPTAVERIVETFADDAATVAVFANPIVHSGTREPAYEQAHAVECAEETINHAVQQVPRAYRVSTLRQCGGWPMDDAAGGRFFEDRLMLARMSSVGVVRHVDEWLYNVRLRDTSLSRTDEARLAKFAILTSEANRRGVSLSITHRRPVLRAQFIPRRAASPCHPWSVIIPVRDRAGLLEITLRSWLESDCLSTGSEIIVVDDASEVPVRNPAGEDRIRVLRSEVPGGPAAARNLGARAARHPMLMFADSDHIVPRDIISVHQWYHDQHSAPALVVGGAFGRRVLTRASKAHLGAVRVDRFLRVIQNHPRFKEIALAFACDEEVVLADASTTGLWRALAPFTFIDSWQLDWVRVLLRYGRSLDGYAHAWSRVGGGNLSIATSAFADLGGFDESFHAAEDWELGARAQKLRMTIAVALEAETYHQIHPPDSLRPRMDFLGRTMLVQKHADLARALLDAPRLDRSRSVNLIMREPAEPISDTRAGGSPPIIALTFDDGPEWCGTVAVLETLAKFSARATFFVLGANARRHPDLLKSLVGAGHELGVHGWHHSDLQRLDVDEIKRTLEQSIRVIAGITGVVPRFFRPAYGNLNAHVTDASRAVGLEPVLWHVSPGDWAQDGWKAQIRRLAGASLAGKVVLLHDGTPEPDDMIQTLDWILHAMPSITIAEYERILPLPTASDHRSGTVTNRAN